MTRQDRERIEKYGQRTGQRTVMTNNKIREAGCWDDWLLKFVKNNKKNFWKYSRNEDDNLFLSLLLFQLLLQHLVRLFSASRGHILICELFGLAWIWVELRNLHVIVSGRHFPTPLAFLFLTGFCVELLSLYEWTTICPFGGGIYCIMVVYLVVHFLFCLFTGRRGIS